MKNKKSTFTSMTKVLKILVLCMLNILVMSSVGYSQNPWNPEIRANNQYLNLKVNGGLHIPHQNTPIKISGQDSSLKIFISGGNFYYTDSIGRIFTLTAGNFFDSTSLSLRIDQRVRFGDTAGMLAPYLQTYLAKFLFYPLDSNPKQYSTVPLVENALQVKNILHSAPSIQEGLFGDMPPPGDIGRIYISIDNNSIYRDSVTKWQLLSSPGGGSTDSVIALFQGVLDAFYFNDVSSDGKTIYFFPLAKLGQGTQIITYPDSTRQVNARLSADANNLLEFGTDSGLYVPTVVPNLKQVLDVGNQSLGDALLINDNLTHNWLNVDPVAQTVVIGDESQTNNGTQIGVNDPDSLIALQAKGGLNLYIGTNLQLVHLKDQAQNIGSVHTLYLPWYAGNVTDTLATLHDLRSLSGITSITGLNGITTSHDTVKLGGVLNGNTTITGASSTYSLNLTSLLSGSFSTMNELDILGGPLVMTNPIFTSFYTPGTYSVDQNNAPTVPTAHQSAATIKLVSSANINVTGFEARDVIATRQGRVMWVLNNGSFNITLKNQSTSSADSNRMDMNSDVTLLPKMMAQFLYNGATARWNIVAVSPNSALPGTVTSIAQGTWMSNSANPITTTGTVGADSAAIANYLLRRGDSAYAYVTPTFLAGKNYLTANQTITLSGNISGSGSTAITTTIGAGVVTNAMLAGSIDLTAKVTGALPIANGGTNNASLSVTAGTTPYMDGSKIVGLAPAPRTGMKLSYNTSTNAPMWTDTTASGGGTALAIGNYVGSSTATSVLVIGSTNTLTQSPSVQIDSANKGLKVTDLTNTFLLRAGGITGFSSSTDWGFYTAGTSRMTLKSTGQLLFGSTTASGTAVVQLRASGVLQFDDGATVAQQVVNSNGYNIGIVTTSSTKPIVFYTGNNIQDSIGSDGSFTINVLHNGYAYKWTERKGGFGNTVPLITPLTAANPVFVDIAPSAGLTVEATGRVLSALDICDTFAGPLNTQRITAQRSSIGLTFGYFGTVSFGTGAVSKQERYGTDLNYWATNFTNGHWNIGPGADTLDRNIAGTAFNGTSLPQIGAWYDATNYTLAGTGSSGFFTINHQSGMAVNSTLGVNTTSAATSTLQVVGSFATAYVAKTANYTATISDETIDCTSNTFTVTLPTAVGITGRIYTVTNSGAGVITIATTSSQTFTNITATPTTLTLATLGSYIVEATGAGWVVKAKL